MTYKFADEARKTAVGMCALVLDGNEKAANELLRLYIKDAASNGFLVCDALACLMKSSVGVAVGLAQDTNTEAEWFHNVGLGLAAKS